MPDLHEHELDITLANQKGAANLIQRMSKDEIVDVIKNRQAEASGRNASTGGSAEAKVTASTKTVRLSSAWQFRKLQVAVAEARRAPSSPPLSSFRVRVAPVVAVVDVAQGMMR